jgi:transposase
LGVALIDGFDSAVLLADRGYDTDAIIAAAADGGIEACIPPKKNRKVQRIYSKTLYKSRHIVENAFLMLKSWRGIATRYAKNTDSFLAAVHIKSTFNWINSFL